MSKEHDWSMDRAFKVHRVLEREQVLQTDDDSWEGVVQEVDYMLENFVPIARTLPGLRRDQRYRITKALRQQAYTEQYVQGADEDSLRDIALRNAWSDRQTIDTLAIKSVAFYAWLYQESKSGLFTPVEDPIEISALARAAKGEKKSKEDIQGLVPVLRELVRSDKIPEAYAEDLKVLFRIADFPLGMSMRDQQAALTKARTLLTIHLTNTRLKPEDKIVENTEGLRYIGRVAKGASVEAIAQLNKDGEHDESEVRRVQGLIARGLNIMYGR